MAAMNLPKITSAFLNVTDDCNLRCRYCFVDKHKNYVNLKTAQDAVDFLAANAEETSTSPSLNFFGGEPMLMWDTIIVPLVLYAKERHPSFTFSITTNGTLLNKTRLRFMKEHNIGLLLSMDGSEMTQNEHRPFADDSGSFDVIAKNIPPILELFPDTMFRATITPGSCDRLYEDMMFAEKSGFRNIFVIPNSLENWSTDAIGTLREQMHLYADHYIHQMEEGVLPILFLAMERRFPMILKRNRAIKSDVMLRAKACEKCGLGSNKNAAIGYDGSIYACQEMCTNAGADSPFYIGSIYSGTDNSKREHLCSLFDSKLVQGDRCGTCPLDRICDGGCVTHNYFANGSIHCASNISCSWERILYDTAVYIMTKLGETGNPLFKDRWEVNLHDRR